MNDGDADPWEDDPVPALDAETMAEIERHAAERAAMIAYVREVTEGHGDHWWPLEHEWLDALSRRPDGTLAGHVFDASPTDLKQDLVMGGYLHTAVVEWEQLVVSGRLDCLMVWAAPDAAASLHVLLADRDERVRLLSLSPSNPEPHGGCGVLLDKLDDESGYHAEAEEDEETSGGLR